MKYCKISTTSGRGCRKKLKKAKSKTQRLASKKMCFHSLKGDDLKNEKIVTDNSRFIW